MAKINKLIKKTILLTMVASVIGCSTIEESYDSLVLEKTFDDDFAHQIESLNTLEDNKKLLSDIENNQDLLSLLEKNKSFDSPNYKYYLEYKMLKTKIAEDEFIKKQKNKTNKPVTINAETRDQVSLKEAIAIENEKLKNATEEQKKEELILKAKLEEDARKEKAKQQKIAADKARADQLKKEKFLNDFYIGSQELYKHELFTLRAHCNDEDSYMIKDDIKGLNDKILALSKNNKDKYNYIINKEQKTIDQCLDIWKSNQVFD